MATLCALPTDTYAPHSVLAEGRWVKIAVPQTGLYRITPAQLRSWGFSSPENVRVYGYGGRRIADRLTAANYIDDLPLVQTETSATGIVFYGVGPDVLETVDNGNNFTVRTSPYTTAGYYFLCENGTAPRAIPESGVAEAVNPAVSFTEVLHHEVDRVSPGEAGPLLVGEEFRLTPTRSFTFDAPDRVDDTPLWLSCSFLAVTPSAASYVDFNVNGVALQRNSSSTIPLMSGSSYQHAMMTVANHSFRIDPSDRLKIDVTHSSPSSAVSNAWLNYLTVNYTRRLAMPSSGTLAFRSASSRLRLEGAADASEVAVWDVTDPLGIMSMRRGTSGSAAEWTNDYTGLRHYVAFRRAATLPAPEFVCTVSNTDLHADSGYDMVIFTPALLRSAAESIADMHRTDRDSLRVKVVDVENVYNEFSSGAADVSGMRKYLKMLYDRDAEAPDAVHRLGYVLLMGRPTYDNRRLSPNMQTASWPTLPAWVNRMDSESLNDSYGYGTDDFIAMLVDDSGGNTGMDNICVAVGRIPATNASEAASFVDKLKQYTTKSSQTPWKNVVVSLADDGDDGIHIKQADSFCGKLLAASGQQHIISKIFTDAYPLVSGVYQAARDEMYHRLDEGAAWWTFIGHATNHSWTGEGMLTYTDVNSLYLRNVPFIYAATCNFLRWDASEISGGEIMFAERNGGCIGIISATRPVYITDNGYFSDAMGRAIPARDAKGRYLRAGDVYRRAKNDIRTSEGIRISNDNRLRFVFCGDPAMLLVTPSNVVRIDSIDGEPFRPDEQPTLAALQRATVSGHIESPDGTLITDFNGTATLELYDAERSLTTAGNNEGSPVTFETQGSKLLSVSAPVIGGRFAARLAMPSDISDNFRPATLNMYATEGRGAREAVGVSRDLYAFGVDESGEPDTEAPVVDQLQLNHTGFASGDVVSTHSPMVLASISDNVGVNISDTGIGRQITLTLDSATTYSNLALYYRPHADGTPGGTINYPMPDVAPGLHNLRLRAWDTSGNVAERTIEFFARADVAPQIFDLYCDANPARTTAGFYITHDAPDANVTVTVTVYNMLGNPVWTRTERGRSDMFTTTPIQWNLCDGTGRRVPRGIYIYRASISVDGETYSTASRKLAVTAY
ncbi:MAG: type IX secretion system sortase PorU [Muribaculaceae bacterium]|nr:type IX secretion system sortase PorU [Muribaculaceae bacterium]